MKKVLISGIVLTGIIIIWGCGKNDPPTREIEAPKDKAIAPAAETVKPPVLPHVITDAEVGQKAVCPVMGTEMTVGKNTLSAEYKGKVYYFCCGGCPDEFKANPEKFAK